MHGTRGLVLMILACAWTGCEGTRPVAAGDGGGHDTALQDGPHSVAEAAVKGLSMASYNA